MQKKKLAVAVLLVIVMLLSAVGTAFAAGYLPVDPDDQGRSGIVGGDTLAFTEDTVWASLTARWGVRVIFQDGDEWNNKEAFQMFVFRVLSFFASHCSYFPLQQSLALQVKIRSLRMKN